MKKQLIVLLILALMLAGCSGSDTPQAHEELRVVTENYPPYNFAGQDGVVRGQSTEIVQAIMSIVGVESEIEVLNFSEALTLTKDGPGVVLFSLNRTVDREELFKWVGPIGVYEQIFFAHVDSGIMLSTLEEAKDVKKIAVYEDDAGALFLQSQGFGNLDISPTDGDALLKLANGEVDLWLGNRGGLAIAAAQAGVDPALFVEMPALIIHANLFIAFSPDVADDVVQAWQDALDKLKEERDDDDKTLIEKIESKYSDPAYLEELLN